MTSMYDSGSSPAKQQWRISGSNMPRLASPGVSFRSDCLDRRWAPANTNLWLLSWSHLFNPALPVFLSCGKHFLPP